MSQVTLDRIRYHAVMQPDEVQELEKFVNSLPSIAWNLSEKGVHNVLTAVHLGDEGPVIEAY